MDELAIRTNQLDLRLIIVIFPLKALAPQSVRKGKYIFIFIYDIFLHKKKNI